MSAAFDHRRETDPTCLVEVNADVHAPGAPLSARFFRVVRARDAHLIAAGNEFRRNVGYFKLPGATFNHGVRGIELPNGAAERCQA